MLHIIRKYFLFISMKQNKRDRDICEGKKWMNCGLKLNLTPFRDHATATHARCWAFKEVVTVYTFIYTNHKRMPRISRLKSWSASELRYTFIILSKTDSILIWHSIYAQALYESRTSLIQNANLQPATEIWSQTQYQRASILSRLSRTPLIRRRIN